MRVLEKKVYLFLVPTFALLVIFSYYPFFRALQYAFYPHWDGIGPMPKPSIDNFIKVFQDRDLGKSVINVFLFLIFTIAKGVIVSVAVAELIFSLRNQKAAYWYRFIFVTPLVVPMIVGLLIWVSFYHKEDGVINHFLTLMGLEHWTRSWLGDPQFALSAIVFMGFPWCGGISLLIVLAGLMNIPQDVIDSVRVDGASGLRRIFTIDIHLIAGQIRLITVMSILGTIQGYEAQMITTDGGPGIATLVPALHLYHWAFRYKDMGYASAIAVLMFIVTLGLTVLNMKLLRSGAEED